MNVALKPDAQRFIQDQVKAGRFSSPDAVVEEAVSRMMADVEIELDDDTAAAINRAEEQLDRGEGVEFDDFAAQIRRKISAR